MQSILHILRKGTNSIKSDSMAKVSEVPNIMQWYTILFFLNLLLFR